MKSTIIAGIVAVLLGISVAATAAPDEAQRQAIQRITAAKQKLAQAEAAKGEQRKMLMGEHMKMMKENMDKMGGMKPKPGMSMHEHEEWMKEHHGMLQQMMDQMMGQHRMMMESK